MEIKNFESILSGMCDTFESLLPSGIGITRSNNNIIYLIIKAVAKGYEVINNVCVRLQNKFDPAYCEDSDLISVAKIVGTSKLSGQSTGLQIVATNTSNTSVSLPAGTYTYDFTSDDTFTFVLSEAVTITGLGQKSFIAYSNNMRRIHVDTRTKISVNSTDEIEIPAEITFGCTDNINLQGYEEETDFEFRKRILNDTTRQDNLVELQTAIRNLPEIFDCRLQFNPSSVDSMEVGAYTIPPMSLLIMVKGEPKNNLAELVASQTIYPTVSQTTEGDDLPYVEYHNDIFTTSEYKVYYAEFEEYPYTAKIEFDYDSKLISAQEVQTAILEACIDYTSPSTYTRYITEAIFYEIVANLNLPSVKVLNVSILVDNEEVDYIELNATYMAKATIVANPKGV